MTPENLLYSKEHEWVKVVESDLIVTCLLYTSDAADE